MKIREAVEYALEHADYCKSITVDQPTIKDYTLTDSDCRAGGYSTWYQGSYYAISNIRYAHNGQPINPADSVKTHRGGDLIGDLIKGPIRKPDPDNILKLIAMAYHIGKETATRQICDIHNERIAKARKAAKSARYHRMAGAILDAMGGDMIYTDAYAGGMTRTFGGDEINLPTAH